MKKKFIMMMTLFIACVSFAQESNRDASGKIQYGPYETNTFFSNWFVEVGGGVNVPVDRVTELFKGNFEHDFGGLAINANVGKWFDPCYGARIGWMGLTTGNLDNHITFKDSFNGDHAFNYIHGDFLLNFSNLVAGYKETRVVNFVPYLTAGAAFAEWKTKRSFAIGAGLEAPIRLGNRINLVPEVQLIAMNSHVYGGDAITGNASASLGLRVNLGKTNWTRKATTVAYYNGLADAANAALTAANESNANKDAKIKALSDENTNLKNTNIRLTDELNDANARANEKKINVKDYTVFFKIGETKLDKTQIAHLEWFVNNYIKPYNKVKFYIAGASDSKTGSVKRNTYLRKQRAEYVCNLLSETYGVRNIEEVEGGLVDINAEPLLSRAVVITVE